MTTDAIPRKRSSAPTSPAKALETTMAAARVSFTWLGVRKTLTTTQKAQAAQTFGAEGHYISAMRRILRARGADNVAGSTYELLAVLLHLHVAGKGLQKPEQLRIQRFPFAHLRLPYVEPKSPYARAASTEVLNIRAAGHVPGGA